MCVGNGGGLRIVLYAWGVMGRGRGCRMGRGEWGGRALEGLVYRYPPTEER